MSEFAPPQSVIPSPGRPLVGRERELAQVDTALAEAAGGEGRILFVVGEMGMGKTRLAEEALALARQRGFSVLVGRTPAAGSGLAYAAILAAFGSMLRNLEPLERDALVGDLLHLGRLWPELGLPPPAPVQDPELERTLLFEAVTRLLERLTTETAVALFIDDLHWADASSLALLGYLVPRLDELPVVLLGAYRPEGMTESKRLRHFVSTAVRSGLASEVPLLRLDPDEVAALAAGILGEDPPASLIDISARAAGTPLFVEALVRGLLDAGSLVRSDEGWTLADDSANTLPRGVRDLVVDRLDLLVPEERSTVELIAHGAQGLPHDVVEGAGGLEADELLGVIGRLVGAGLVIQEEDGWQVIYRLTHPLIQEVAAAELPAVAGRRLHARLARTVEQLRPRDLDRLAYHYSRAGAEVDPGRALDILLEAGERAHGLSAHDEAARHFGAALLLIRNGRRSELMAYVLERLGESWEPVGETAAAMEVWTEALGECARAADSLGAARLHRRLAMAARSLGDMDSARRHLAAGVDTLRDLPPSEELVDLCHARLEVDSPIADPDRAQDAVAELGRLAKILATPRAAAEVLLAEAQLAWARGDYAVSRGRAEEAVRVAEEAREWLLARRAHRELAWLGWVFGHPDAIRLHAHSQLEIDRRLGAPVNESIPQMQLGVAALLIGDWDEATWLVEGAVADARRYEERRALTMCLGVLAMVRILRGDVDAAEECLAEARQVFPDFAADPRGGLYLLRMPEAMLALERGDAPGTQVAAAVLRAPVAQAWVGTAQVLGGDLDDALATAAILAVDGPPGSYPAALADRVVGLVEHARGETEAARMHLDRSTETLATLRLPFEAAVSQLHTGTVESARLALATFEALGAARYADRARRVLRGLGVRLPSARSGRGPDQRLSRRELEVARLVAEGLSNAEIAERLVLSVRTVGSHLDHIYGRLGISSRVALARWLTTAESPSAT